MAYIRMSVLKDLAFRTALATPKTGNSSKYVYLNLALLVVSLGGASISSALAADCIYYSQGTGGGSESPTCTWHDSAARVPQAALF
eukprot:2075363-Pleurochrysis_carterae.AAC.1